MTRSGGRWAIPVGMALAALAGGLVWLGHAATQESREGPRPFLAGGERLSLPGAYFRPSRDDDAVELVAFFPDFQPAGRFDDIGAGADLDERFQRLVFLELRAADPRLDPAERTSRLYSRFLVESSWSHPGGLVARKFEDGSPFEGDELFYTPPDGRDFAARCRQPDPERKTPNTCIASFRTRAIDVELRFSAGLISQWQALIAGARGVIETARR